MSHNIENVNLRIQHVNQRLQQKRIKLMHPDLYTIRRQIRFSRYAGTALFTIGAVAMFMSSKALSIGFCITGTIMLVNAAVLNRK